MEYHKVDDKNQVSVLWNCGLWAHIEPGGDIQCDQVGMYDGEKLVNYVSNNISAKGEGRREPFFLLVNTRRTIRQSSRPSVVTKKSHQQSQQVVRIR